MNTMTAHVPESFMKQARELYRVRGGKALALVSGLLFMALVGLLSQTNFLSDGALPPTHAVRYILIDLSLLVVILAYAVAYRATLLWQRARDGQIGTRLQSRIIVMFSAIAILPTLVVASFSILFFNVGIKNWFDTQVASSLQNSISVATAYIDEHRDAIRNDVVDMAQTLHPQLALLQSSTVGFGDYLTKMAADRKLSEAIVFDRQHTIARSALSFSLMFERFPEPVFDRADDGKIAVFGDDQDKIQAVIKLSSLPEMYLLVVRTVDPQVIEHLHKARATVSEFEQLDNTLAHLQRQFFTVFILVAMLVLLSSLWAGMLLAVRLVEPLRALMIATERVRAGDYTTRVPEGRAEDEIANLGRTFNRMTGQLETQRRDLVEANRLADERRRFTEIVLAGVSAGVLALDAKKNITLHNRSALELLEHENILHQPIDTIMPEMSELVAQAEKKPDRVAGADVVLAQGERRRTLHIRVAAERFMGRIEGYIVTFDDMTALVSAQRNAAWADVARRIAHEIKNPLTPITLSAERIRKKFGHGVAAEDKESFERYLDTIARHVRDIGRMVEEFVSFARLPASVFREENLVSIIRKSVFSEQTVHPEIKYITTLPDHAVPFAVDETQFGQMLLNLMKNAAEAMGEPSAARSIDPKDGSATQLKSSPTKEIHLTLSETADEITLTLRDTGPGYPLDKIATLTEPYVTTRAKGTGLGLAIVKRSVEEHKGTLVLSNAAEGGAVATITLRK